MKRFVFSCAFLLSSTILCQTYPVIASQPQNKTAIFGGTVTFSVSATYHRETAWAVGNNGTILRYGSTNSSPDYWSRNITIQDNNNNLSINSFGQANNASNSIDIVLGESEHLHHNPLEHLTQDSFLKIMNPQF